MHFEVTLSSHCPSLSKITQTYAIPPQSRTPKQYPVTFLRQNATSFVLHPPSHIPTYSYSTPHPLRSACCRAAQPHHPFWITSPQHPQAAPPHTMVPTNSLVCPSPARRTVLIADSSLQTVLWLLQVGKSSWAQLNTSDQLWLSVEKHLKGLIKYHGMGRVEEFYCVSLEQFICYLCFRQCFFMGNFCLFLRQV